MSGIFNYIPTLLFLISAGGTNTVVIIIAALISGVIAVLIISVLVTGIMYLLYKVSMQTIAHQYFIQE